MIAVVLSGVALGMGTRMARRSAAFRAEAARHGRIFLDMQPAYQGCTIGQPAGEMPGLEHYELMLKYNRVARSPWLAVEPDPPAAR